MEVNSQPVPPTIEGPQRIAGLPEEAIWMSAIALEYAGVDLDEQHVGPDYFDLGDVYTPGQEQKDLADYTQKELLISPAAQNALLLEAQYARALLRNPGDDIDQIYDAGITAENRAEAVRAEAAWNQLAASAAYRAQQDHLLLQREQENNTHESVANKYKKAKKAGFTVIKGGKKLETKSAAPTFLDLFSDTRAKKSA